LFHKVERQLKLGIGDFLCHSTDLNKLSKYRN
jgi:hypothetical protein